MSLTLFNEGFLVRSGVCLGEDTVAMACFCLLLFCRVVGLVFFLAMGPLFVVLTAAFRRLVLTVSLNDNATFDVV